MMAATATTSASASCTRGRSHLPALRGCRRPRVPREAAAKPSAGSCDSVNPQRLLLPRSRSGGVNPDKLALSSFPEPPAPVRCCWGFDKRSVFLAYTSGRRHVSSGLRINTTRPSAWRLSRLRVGAAASDRREVLSDLSCQLGPVPRLRRCGADPPVSRAAFAISAPRNTPVRLTVVHTEYRNVGLRRIATGASSTVMPRPAIGHRVYAAAEDLAAHRFDDRFYPEFLRCAIALRRPSRRSSS